MKKQQFLGIIFAASFLASGCLVAPATPTPIPPTPTFIPTATAIPTETLQPTSTPIPLVPNFSHIAILIFENEEFSSVINSAKMPYFNLFANTYTLLTQYYATTHPSLPNYLSMIGGDTFGITDDCDFSDCYISAPNLTDSIEQSGRTWKTYQDDMPEPCFKGDTIRYVRKHNPFIFFDDIRTNDERCKRSIVPLTQMDVDIAANQLPNFFFITPDICYSGHDCAIELADQFVQEQTEKVYKALAATGEPFLIVITWDEGQGTHSCCGLPETAGGRVATILISPQAKPAFQDSTPYDHYSLLKTIEVAWGLPLLGHSVDPETPLITTPWK